MVIGIVIPTIRLPSSRSDRTEGAPNLTRENPTPSPVSTGRFRLVIERATSYAADMSQAAPEPIEPPEPTPEQLEAWRALVERVRAGDRSEVIPWDQAADELGL
jgi:hypothetical protein